MMDRESLSEWAKDKPLSILQLDPADRAVLRIAGERNFEQFLNFGLFSVPFHDLVFFCWHFTTPDFFLGFLRLRSHGCFGFVDHVIRYAYHVRVQQLK